MIKKWQQEHVQMSQQQESLTELRKQFNQMLDPKIVK
jgi:hypothetical protein